MCRGGWRLGRGSFGFRLGCWSEDISDIDKYVWKEKLSLHAPKNVESKESSPGIMNRGKPPPKEKEKTIRDLSLKRSRSPTSPMERLDKRKCKEERMPQASISHAIPYSKLTDIRFSLTSQAVRQRPVYPCSRIRRAAGSTDFVCLLLAVVSQIRRPASDPTPKRYRGPAVFARLRVFRLQFRHLHRRRRLPEAAHCPFAVKARSNSKVSWKEVRPRPVTRAVSLAARA